MTLFAMGDDNTPLTVDEQAALIPNLATKEELNEWERSNILTAQEWALETTPVKRQNFLTEAYVRELHWRMFDQTWKWAGKYRVTEKNIGIPHYQIREAVVQLLGDARYWMEQQTYAPDEIAVRLHHRLVAIHPFSNGNGRHARLMADVMAKIQGRPLFSWGGADIARAGDYRKRYIDALRAADQHELGLLLAFVRS